MTFPFRWCCAAVLLTATLTADTLKLPHPRQAQHSVLQPVLDELTRQNPDAARRELNRALSANPKLGAAHELDGILKANESNFLAAEAALRRALGLDPSLTNVRLLLGQVLHQQGKYDDAQRMMRSQLEFAPQNRAAHLYLGRYAAARNDSRAAIHHFYQTLPPVDDEGYDGLLKLAELHLAAGDVARTGHRLAECTGSCQSRPAYKLVRAKYLGATGSGVEAERLLARLVEEAPNAAEAWLELGEVRRTLRKPDAAEEAFRRAVNLAGGRRAALGLALIKADRKEWDQAVSILRSSIAESASPDAYVVLSQVQASRGDPQAARSVLEELQRAHPVYAPGYVLLGMWHMAQKQPALARPHFEKGLRLDPGSVQAAVSLANIASVEHRMRDAEAILRTALTATPGNPELLIQLGALCEHENDWAGAVSAYRDLLQAHPDFLPAMNNLALAFVRVNGNLEEAERLMRRAGAGSRSPDLVSANLGWILVNRGKLQEGVPLLEKGLVRLKDNPELHFFLSEGYRRQGRAKEAQEQLRLARELGLPPDYAIVPSPTAGMGVFSCPMHPGLRARTAGKCPKCGMALTARSTTGPYTLEIMTSQPPPPAGVPATIEFRVKHPKTAQIVRDFEVIHERLFHFYLVSADLTWFRHDHPQLGPDGVLRFTATLPKPGEYHLISDFFPQGGSPQLIATTIRTAGAGITPPLKLAPDLSPKRDVNLGVSLRTEPAAPVAGENTRLVFSLADAQGLEQYLGAWGHMLIMSADGAEVIHGHPSEYEPGRQIVFDVTFPRKHTYKLWTQFQKSGAVNTVSFALNVP